MNPFFKYFTLVDRKQVFRVILTIIFLLFARKKRNCMLFTAKRSVTIAELSAHARIAHVVVCSCRKFEKHCLKIFTFVSNKHYQNPKYSRNQFFKETMGLVLRRIPSHYHIRRTLQFSVKV
jgi:hypothetical protein